MPRRIVRPFILSVAVMVLPLVGIFSQSIHDRQLAIIRDEDQDSWLRTDARPGALKSLLTSIPAAEMKSRPVGLTVNHPQFDDPSVVERTNPNLEIPRTLFEL